MYPSSKESPFPPKINEIGTLASSSRTVAIAASADERTRDYVLRVSVRGDGHEECVVRIEDVNGGVLACEAVPVTDRWKRHEISLELDDQTDWDGETSYDCEEMTLTAGSNGRVILDLPPAAIVRLDVDD